MDEQTLIKEIKEKQFDFLERMLTDKQLYYSFNKLIEKEDAQQAVVAVLAAIGIQAQTDRTIFDRIFALLDDSSARERLRELFFSKAGSELLRKAVTVPGGEFLILGTMGKNYEKSHAFVNTLLIKRHGRQCVADIVHSAAGLQQNTDLFKSKGLSEGGKKLTRILSQNAREMERSFFIDQNDYVIVDYIEQNQEEAAAIIQEALADEKKRSQLCEALKTDVGKSICVRIGKTGFGRIYGAGKLWLTDGGRRFVHSILVDEHGAYAVYGIMTGMSLAEFITYTVALE